MPNKKDEIENRFTAARHVMDDLCRTNAFMEDGAAQAAISRSLPPASRWRRSWPGRNLTRPTTRNWSCGSSVSCTPPPGCPYRILRSGICKKEESECQN